MHLKHILNIIVFIVWINLEKIEAQAYLKTFGISQGMTRKLFDTLLTDQLKNQLNNIQLKELNKRKENQLKIIKEQTEKKRLQIYKDQLLSRVKSTIFRDIYGRFLK